MLRISWFAIGCVSWYKLTEIVRLLACSKRLVELSLIKETCMSCMTVVGMSSAVPIASCNSVTVVTEDGISARVVPGEASASQMSSNAARHDVPCPEHTPVTQRRSHQPKTSELNNSGTSDLRIFCMLLSVPHTSTWDPRQQAPFASIVATGQHLPSESTITPLP